MSLTINLTLFKRKAKKDGTIPIYIRITEDRKSRYKSTGISVKESDWNTSNQKVRKTNRRYEHLNIELKKQLGDIEDIRQKLYKEDRLGLLEIMEELSDESDPRSISDQLEKYKAYLKDEDRYWERRHFSVIINNVSSYLELKSPGDSLDALTPVWIEGFQKYLIDEVKNSNTTVAKKIRRYQGFIKWLIKRKLISSNPTIGVNKVSSERTSTKTKLTFDQIKAIEDLSLDKGSKLWHVRNYFLFSFYNAGIRFGDLCTLTWQNLIDGRLIYSMQKTGGTKSIQQFEPMQRILDLYRNSDKGSTDYIFPILKKKITDPMYLRKRIASNNTMVNKRLKKIAKKAGIESNISFHVSRHSFAQFALTKGMDLYSISKALGHSDLKITEEYLKSFDEELLDKSMGALFSK